MKPLKAPAKKAKKANNVISAANNTCTYVAHSELEAFIEKFTYPQSMDTDNSPEMDMTTAFDTLVSEQKSAFDFAAWRRALRATSKKVHALNLKTASRQRKMFVLQEEDEIAFIAPRNTRDHGATMGELKSLYVYTVQG